MTDDKELVARLRSKIIIHTDAAVWMLEAADCIEALTKERDEGMTEALSLAKSLHEQFYREQVPQWEPLEDVAGVISQIDNMVAGIAEQLAAARHDAKEAEAYADELEKGRDVASIWNEAVDEALDILDDEGWLGESRERIELLKKPLGGKDAKRMMDEGLT